MQKGKIIFLNGVSSSGKTSLAKVLQHRLTEPFYALGPDTLILMSPEKYLNRNPESGPIILNMVHMLPHTVKLFADHGLNLIVDHVLGNPGIMDYLALLHDYPVLFVHVTCPAEELRRREKERGDRGIGTAERQLLTLYPQDTYDITVDTFNETKEKCTDRIIDLLEHTNRHAAFQTLWFQRSELNLKHAKGFNITK